MYLASVTSIDRNVGRICVPADVCENCGEYYLSEDVTATVLALGEDVARRGAVVEILRYAA